jgi:hypothetical protein
VGASFFFHSSSIRKTSHWLSCSPSDNAFIPELDLEGLPDRQEIFHSLVSLGSDEGNILFLQYLLK